MPDADNAFIRATDDLIALYRSVERSTFDLPVLSLMPLLIFLWAVLKFYFFLVIGIVLIIPTNLVILIRNLFPGNWRYRPFFLSHLYYVWLWIWRGEAPTAPSIFIRPLLNLFIREHFESRLRRLRLEILDGELSDGTRTTLLGRLDAALERWKSPRFATLFYTVVVPAIISLPSWYKQFVEFVGSLGIHMPTDAVRFVSERFSSDALMILGVSSVGYLMAIPVTAFLAKRSLFIGVKPDRICFPGGQGGAGIYLKEREILAGVGLRARETPIDLWILGVVFALGYLFLWATWDHWTAWMRSLNPDTTEAQFLSQVVLQLAVLAGLFFVAAIRRGRAGRV